MQGNYSVTVESFAERHFIKSFQKKYKTSWDITLSAIVAEFERIDMLLQTDRAETITDTGSVKIVKTSFRVVGTKESAKTSGNRCILTVNEMNKNVSMLLVYCKTDLSGKNETSEWKELVKENYKELKNIF